MDDSSESKTLLDAVMDDWEVNDAHSIWVSMAPQDAYEAIKATTARQVRMFGPLMAARSVFSRLKRRSEPMDYDRPLLEHMIKGGIVPLAEDADREIVLGAVGRFWRPTGNAALSGIDSTEKFAEFDEPGFAKVAMNFRVAGEGSGSRIFTETRVACTSRGASRKFRIYWLLIKPGSAAIRRSWLGSVRRRSASPQKVEESK